MVAWATVDTVALLLGPGPGDDYRADPAAQLYVDAANVVAFSKRATAGYIDPADSTAPAPDKAIELGTSMYALALWRERASTDGYPSFDTLTAYTPTAGSWGQIKRLLGIGKAAVDAPPADPVVTPSW